ncbi:MAG: hypothetical protein K2G06_05415 [Muribaculaceae bacterium]|nr:hypothetical protein [Muribaculaceae bacterium]
MKRFMYFTMCLCAMFAVLSSCSSGGNGLIGKWEQTISEAGANAVATYDFKDNGKMTQTMVMKSETPSINIEGEGTCDYTYSEADKTITFKFSASDFNFKTFEIEGIDEASMEMAMDQMKSQMVNMEQKFTNVNIDGDKLTANFNGQEVEMKRM